MAHVVIMMGSKSDEEKVAPCADILKQLGISYVFTVSSAHRTPEEAHEFAANARKNGIEVIICAAGKARSISS